MSSLVLDTNTLLRYLLNDIPEQAQKIQEKIKQAKSGKIKLFVPQIVIFEIFFALVEGYDFNKDRVIEGIEKIIASEDLFIQDKEAFKLALEIFKEKKLSLVDCFLAAVAKEQGIRVFTFDKALQKI